MKEKYIEERFPHWFIFGHASNDETLVDINDGNSDVYTRVPYRLAKEIVEARQHFVHQIVDIFNYADREDVSEFLRSN
jgi:hypothetical protein